MNVSSAYQPNIERIGYQKYQKCFHFIFLFFCFENWLHIYHHHPYIFGAILDRFWSNQRENRKERKKEKKFFYAQFNFNHSFHSTVNDLDILRKWTFYFCWPNIYNKQASQEFRLAISKQLFFLLLFRFRFLSKWLTSFFFC